MECHYHPERESTDICAICGKPICKECGLEIAGKIYCKDCLQKIVGLGLDNKSEPEEAAPEEAAPAENIYDTQEKVSAPQEEIYAPQEESIYASEEPITQEYQGVSEDSPYNIKDSIEQTGGLESSYLHESEEPQKVEQNEVEYYAEEPISPAASGDDFIYPDHSYEPEPTSARLELEDKYEKYLDDLYFDESEVPLEEQLAKDEEQYGSLTRKPYKAPETPAKDQVRAKPKKPETPEEMEARIRAEIMAEQGVEPKEKKSRRGIRSKDQNIHNLNYQDEKEPMGVVDILLTVILVIVILVVIYYLIYLFVLSSSYPTFMDAIYGLSNPQNVINNILSGRG